MPKNKNAYQRYLIIHSQVRRNRYRPGYPTKEDLLRILNEQGYDVSGSTLEKDLCFLKMRGVLPSSITGPKNVTATHKTGNSTYLFHRRVIHEDEEGVTLKLRVKVTWEFIMECILRFGDTVTVLDPPDLADRVKAILRNALDVYGNK